MMRQIAAISVILVFTMLVNFGTTVALDPPHDDSNLVNCYSCHVIHGALGPSLTIESAINNLCESCHYEAGPAREATAHRGQTCTICHEPHFQEQNNTYGSTYGKLIRLEVETPNSGTKDVIFTGPSNANSFADGDDVYDGICEVCHTQTAYHRNTSDGDHSHYAGSDCIDCHGHASGAPGATSASHSAHLSEDYGPQLQCSDCHQSVSPPLFTDGENFTNTNVCNVCHSPGGTYDGVNDSQIGAKPNWADGVYSGGTLAPGKEKWCAGCHDESPAVIQTVSAPNVIGDEDANINYGIGYGFYKTGHGLPSFDTYPASGSTIDGAALTCEDCHDATMKHIDGEARTYIYTATVGDPDDYQHGYRLKSVNGGVPMLIPREGGCNPPVLVNPDDFRLCFSCHDSDPFTNQSNFSTSFRHDPNGPSNSHYYHLAIKEICGPGPQFTSDWGTHNYDSRVSCVTCHNVHGSTQLSMVRDGKLVNRVPGLQLVYYNETVSYQCGGSNPYDPTPADVNLPDSTGTVWNEGAIGTFCGNCHGSCGFDSLYLRTPEDIYPPEFTSVYGAVGSDSLTVNFSEGTYSSSNGTGDLVIGDFTLTDTDNGRTITGVTHTAGDATATLTLSTALDSTNDIGTDTLAASTTASIYDVFGNPMDTTPIVISSSDNIPPTIASQNPTNGAVDIAVDSDITFTLSDGGDGVDWTTFSIQLSGDKGYSQTYTDDDFTVATKTGTPASYDVTVNPDTNFGGGELITVTVNVDDLASPANSMTAAVWSFTTLNPEMLTLHPWDIASNPGGYYTTFGGSWADVLDSNNGDTSYAVSGTGSSGQVFYVDMDDPTGLGGATINSITIYVYARHVSGYSPIPPPIAANVNIGYKTGAATIWKGDTATDASGNYNLIASSTYNTDSDLGPLDLTDINNLQISVQRSASGSTRLRVTEVYVEVTYTP